MSSGERRKKKLSVFFRIPLLLGLFLAVITVLIYFIYWPVGVILTVYLGIYFIFTLYMYLNNSEILRREMLEFATNYDQIQGELLRNFDVPYALLDDTGKIEWMNDAFAGAVQKDTNYRRSITTIFPSIRRESLPKDDKEIRIQVEREGYSFMARVKKLNMADLIPSNTMLDEKAKKGELYSLFLIDDTAARLAIQEVDDQSVVVGFVYIDNYEEAVDTLEDVRKSLLVALIGSSRRTISTCSRTLRQSRSAMRWRSRSVSASDWTDCPSPRIMSLRETRSIWHLDEAATRQWSRTRTISPTTAARAGR